jgi:glycerol-3-phosphate acyltransferase PlsX
VLGAVEAIRADSEVEIVLAGDEAKIREVLLASGDFDKKRVSIRHASDVIEMHEHPGVAVRRKKDSSLVVATKLVKDGECDAVLSAGSTGAAVAAALFGLGRISGIDRPSIATPIPNMNGVTLLLDSGANVDSKPNQMVQSAIMGSIYAEYVMGIENPKVGLLNIGEESTKGNEQALTVYPMLEAQRSINFIGNAEGRDIPKGTVDVVVCDGFVGNVVLKFGEGLAKTLFKLIKEAIKEHGILAKAGALLLSPALKNLRKRMDASEYGGAPLVGVNGCFIICHGSSNAKAIKSAIGVAKEYVNTRVLEHIKDNIAKEEEKTNADN